MNTELIRKYNVAGPRYTSYPTVPYWDGVAPSEAAWERHVLKAYKAGQGLSLYIHLPYCESLCTYCGCNTRITVNHAVEKPYVKTILREWKMYRQLFGKHKPLLKELHLGGGTPTFFSPENLKFLIDSVKEDCQLAPAYEFSFEGHPNNTSREHLQVLFNIGFRRVSFGIQDFDPEVQQIINRVQPYENVVRVTREAREIGYTSINYDLVYGLPFQTIASVADAFDKVIDLKPDRIAYYSYAHVPWLKPGQRRYTEADLPSNEYKRQLYELGKRRLEMAGYLEVGMDHFALPEDELYKAAQSGSLHRNFMGYTTQNSSLQIGLGASAISDTWTAFGQNIKAVEEYRRVVDEGRFPLYRGHELTVEDKSVRQQILDLMCRFATDLSDIQQPALLYEIHERLKELEEDNLIEITASGIKINEKGRAFVRNVCMAFDVRMWRNKPETQLFSSTV